MVTKKSLETRFHKFVHTAVKLRQASENSCIVDDISPIIIPLKFNISSHDKSVMIIGLMFSTIE